jgi:transcriptional regulator with XRE-family HTH domain
MLYFGDRVKALRTEKGLTQQQLADKLGLVKSSVSAYEKSAKYPSVEKLMELCDFFCVSSDYLLGRSDSMELKMSGLTDDQVQMITRFIVELEQYNNLRDNMK